MTTTSVTQQTNVRHALPATIAGLAAVALAIYQVAVPGSPDASYESVTDWLRESLTLVFLVASVVGAVFARRAGFAPAPTPLLMWFGYGLIATGVLIGMVLREDPDWFFLLAGPGLLASAGAFLVWAWWGWRRRILPAYDVLLCALGGVTALALAEFGTSVLIGAHWLYVAARIRGVGESSMRR